MIPAIVVLVIGLALLGWGYFGQRKAAAMAATPTLTCAEITESALPVTCEVKGSAVPGPRGSIKAPFSQRECVWYRATVTVQHVHHEYRDGRHHTETRNEVVHDDTCREPFGIRDATGQILVRHGGRQVDAAAQSLDRYEPAGPQVELFGLSIRVNFSDIRGHRYEEWIVPPGEPLYALGGANGGNGQLVLSDPQSGPFIISARSEEALSSAMRTRSMVGYIGGGVVVAGSLVWLAIRMFSG